jgi:hypothetical protein
MKRHRIGNIRWLQSGEKESQSLVNRLCMDNDNQYHCEYHLSQVLVAAFTETKKN